MTIFRLHKKRKATFDTWECHVKLKNGKSAVMRKEGGFCADPFLLSEHIVLFEYYCFEEARGWIESWNLVTGKSYKIFDNGAHSSFPFLFSCDGVDYVLPEQKAFSLLEAMPIDWRRDGSVRVAEKRAIKLCSDVPIVDAMVLKHQGNLYCLYNEDVGLIGDPGGTLMFARMRVEPQGLDVHNATIISSDFRTARNAGSVWSQRGAIYRVFQNKHAASYGNGIGLERINLDPEGSVTEPSSRNLIYPQLFKKHKLDRLSHHLDIKPFGIAWDVRPAENKP